MTWVINQHSCSYMFSVSFYSAVMLISGSCFFSVDAVFESLQAL